MSNTNTQLFTTAGPITPIRLGCIQGGLHVCESERAAVMSRLEYAEEAYSGESSTRGRRSMQFNKVTEQWEKTPVTMEVIAHDTAIKAEYRAALDALDSLDLRDERFHKAAEYRVACEVFPAGWR